MEGLKPDRAKTVIRLLADRKVNTLIGVRTFPASPEEWNVLVAPMQVFQVTDIAMALHFHGFRLHYGPVAQPDGSQREQFVIEDTLPDMLPEGEEIEETEVDPDVDGIVYFEGGEPGVRWRPIEFTPYEPPPEPTHAKTGGEGMWRPDRPKK